MLQIIQERLHQRAALEEVEEVAVLAAPAEVQRAQLAEQAESVARVAPEDWQQAAVWLVQTPELFLVLHTRLRPSLLLVVQQVTAAPAAPLERQETFLVAPVQLRARAAPEQSVALHI